MPRKLHPFTSDPSFQSGYRQHATEYGVQYYLAARTTLIGGLSPVCASLAHHAVELLLKACLSADDPGDVIARYGEKDSYGHKLVRLWAEFRKRNAHLKLDPSLDGWIESLDAFEDLRYPDTLVIKGAMINIGLVEPDVPSGSKDVPADRQFHLYLPALDRLVSLLLIATGISFDYLNAQLMRPRQRLTTYAAEVANVPLLVRKQGD